MVVIVVVVAAIQLLYRLWISNEVALIKRSVQKAVSLALAFVIVVVDVEKGYGDIVLLLRVACSAFEEEAEGAYVEQASTSSTRIGPNWLILS